MTKKPMLDDLYETAHYGFPAEPHVVHKPCSWAPEVIADSSGIWCGNALRFATRREATEYVHDLHSRWTLVQRMRVVESDDPVNYAWRDGHLIFLGDKLFPKSERLIR